MQEQVNNIVIFGSPHSGKTTLVGYLASGMFSQPVFNKEVYQNLKKIKTMYHEDDLTYAPLGIDDLSNPINVSKDIVLPSFAVLNKDELNEIAKKNPTSLNSPNSKHIHRRMLKLFLTSEGTSTKNSEKELSGAKQVNCVCTDIPGFLTSPDFLIKAFSQGSIGIAVISLSDILNYIAEDDAAQKNNKKNIFEPLKIWCLLKNPKTLIIALSKIDEHDTAFQPTAEGILEDSYTHDKPLYLKVQKAIECLRQELSKYCNVPEAVPICPMSIQVFKERNINVSKNSPSIFFKRYAHNVYTDSLPSYLKPNGTLIMELKNKFFNTQSKILFEDVNFENGIVDRVFTVLQPDSNSKQEILSIQVSNGTLRTGDEILLGPVVTQYDNTAVFLEATVSSIKPYGYPEFTKKLYEGTLGGVGLNKIISGHNKQHLRIPKYKDKSEQHDFEFLATTMLFARNLKKVTGNAISVLIDIEYYIDALGDHYIDEYYSMLSRIFPNQFLEVYWYGKKITMNVVEIVSEGGVLKLTLQPNKQELMKASDNYFSALITSEGLLKYKDDILIAFPLYSQYHERGEGGKTIFSYVHTQLDSIITTHDYNFINLEIDNACLDTIPENRFKQSFTQTSQNKWLLRKSFKTTTELAGILKVFRKSLSSSLKNHNAQNTELSLFLS